MAPHPMAPAQAVNSLPWCVFSFLGYVDMLGVAYEAPTLATGYGAYLAQVSALGQGVGGLGSRPRPSSADQPGVAAASGQCCLVLEGLFFFSH